MRAQALGRYHWRARPRPGATERAKTAKTHPRPTFPGTGLAPGRGRRATRKRNWTGRARDDDVCHVRRGLGGGPRRGGSGTGRGLGPMEIEVSRLASLSLTVEPLPSSEVSGPGPRRSPTPQTVPPSALGRAAASLPPFPPPFPARRGRVSPAHQDGALVGGRRDGIGARAAKEKQRGA